MIKNATKNSILVKDLEIAKSVGKKTKGLMFRKEIASDSGLLMIFGYDRKHEMWMFGMRFPIDIVFIDKEKRIVDIKHSVRPMGKNPMTWRVYKPKQNCRYVLEVNSGLIKKTKTEIGDILDFET